MISGEITRADKDFYPIRPHSFTAYRAPRSGPPRIGPGASGPGASEKESQVTNDLGTVGRCGSKRGFGGFRGVRRLHLATVAVDHVEEPGPVAPRQMSWEGDRRRRFEAIALPHLDAAYTLARWLTRNEADAADAVQEAFLRAFRYFDSYRGDDAKSWVLKIVRRSCYNWLERNRPADVISLEAEEERLDAVATSAIDFEALLESRSNLRLLGGLIGALPAPLREAIVLRELHELGYREIAEVTGVPIGTVMSRLHRARALLLRAYSQAGGQTSGAAAAGLGFARTIGERRHGATAPGGRGAGSERVRR
jgi:RNA polymerase sigma-70 factor, ECF subfamily